jgi:hypothetical protein
VSATTALGDKLRDMGLLELGAEAEDLAMREFVRGRRTGHGANAFADGRQVGYSEGYSAGWYDATHEQERHGRPVYSMETELYVNDPPLWGPRSFPVFKDDYSEDSMP